MVIQRHFVTYANNLLYFGLVSGFVVKKNTFFKLNSIIILKMFYFEIIVASSNFFGLKVLVVTNYFLFSVRVKLKIWQSCKKSKNEMKPDTI